MRYASRFRTSDFHSQPSVRHTLYPLVLLLATAVALVTVAMLAGCSSKEKTVAPQNLPPSINGILLNPTRTAPGDTITASAVAGDPEGRTLSYLWRASRGTLIDSLSQSVEWIAPPAAATCTLTVNVSDGANAVSLSRSIPVGIGCIVIESYPQGATILIDSEPTQYSTPVTISHAPAGSYVLQVERSPYVYSPGSSTVEVTNGDTARVRFKLSEGVMMQTQMTTSNCITQSSWESDGTSVVCAVRGASLGYQVVSIFDSPWPDAVEDDIETGGQPNWGPSWCPTDCYVLFASSRNTGSDHIFKVPICDYPYGGTAVRMYPYVANYPVWSPDGYKIAFVAVDSLKVMNSSGGSATTIATGVAEDRPSWSPGGDQIVFSKDVGGEPYLFSVSSTGGTPTQVSQISGSHPSWSPDGNKIAFVSSLDGNENVWILFLDATPTPVEGQLTSSGANWPAWRPDGAALCFTVLDEAGGTCSSLWLATQLPF